MSVGYSAECSREEGPLTRTRSLLGSSGGVAGIQGTQECFEKWSIIAPVSNRWKPVTLTLRKTKKLPFAISLTASLFLESVNQIFCFLHPPKRQSIYYNPPPRPHARSG